MDKNMRAYLAELFGTFALVFICAGVVCSDTCAAISGFPRPGLIGIALAQGFVLAAALAVTLPHSGGYLNPAITVVLWVNNKFDFGKAFALIFSQLLGGAMAGGLLRLIFTEAVLRDARLGTPHLNLVAYETSVERIPFSTALGGVAMELALTFVLTLVIFATLIDPRAQRKLGVTGTKWATLWVGLAMSAAVFAGFAVTGAAVNPARWFGTVVWEATVPSLQLMRPYADHVVYWMGPILGALLAGQVYTWLILPADHEAAVASTSTPAKLGAGASSTLFRAKK